MISQQNRHSRASAFLRSAIPQVPVDLSAHCSETADIFGVTIAIGREFTTVISAYVWLELSWDPEGLREINHACLHRLLFYGDESTHNTFWGSSFSSVRGRDLSVSITGLDLLVLNDGSLDISATKCFLKRAALDCCTTRHTVTLVSGD